MPKEQKIKEPKSIGIHFGIISFSIATQLNEQGLPFKKDDATEFNNCKEAINTLSICGILSDNQKEKAQGKLFTQIKSHVKAQMKLKKNQPKKKK